MKLLDSFTPITPEAWLQQIEKDLKGKPLEKLIWQPDADLRIAPWATAEDVPQNEGFTAQRGNLFHTMATGWQPVAVCKTNQDFQQALQHEFAAFSIQVSKDTDLTEALKSFSTAHHALHVAGELSDNQLHDLNSLDKSLFLTGTHTLPHQFLHAQADKIRAAEQHTPYYKQLGIDVRDWANSPVWQLAIAISDWIETIEQLKPQLSLSQIFQQSAVRFPVGSLFFVEIAKLRAFRWLYQEVGKIYKMEEIENFPCFILSETTFQNKSGYDAHTNLLRLTTEAMSAILGGTNGLIVQRYDAHLTEENSEFAARISANIHHLLQHESYFDKVTDAVGGSYYIEKLTSEMAKTAWKYVQEIEQNGGYKACYEKGFFRNKLTEINLATEKEIATRKRTLVGINNYPNTQEIKTDFSYQPQGIAREIEQLRIKTDEFTSQTGKRPLIHLWLLREGAMPTARALFVRNLLGCGGFDLSESYELNPHAAATVLCAADETYFEIGAKAIADLHQAVPNSLILLAGKPENWESLGAEMPLFMGMNLVEIIKTLQIKMSITQS